MIDKNRLGWLDTSSAYELLLSGSTEIDLNEVVNYSKWVSNLLSDNINKKKRTIQDNNREYNYDKWGKLLDQLENQNLGIENADELYYGNEETICIVNNKLYQTKSILARRYYNNLIYDYLDLFTDNEPVIELGAGYGTVILNFLERIKANGGKRDLYGFEFTENGQACIRELDYQNGVHVGFCDFSQPFEPGKIPEGSVILTSMSLMMLPELPQEFFLSIIKLKPKVVISFEAIIDFCEDNMIGMLQRRYIIENDYNQNYYHVLLDMEKRGLVKINKINKNLFAENFLLPTSIITWKPN